MNNSWQIKHSFWYLVIFSFIILVILLYIFLQFKVEKSFQTWVIIDQNNHNAILLDSQKAYLINYQSKVTLKINDQYFQSKINFIKYSPNQKMFIVELNALPYQLIPHSTLPAHIIYQRQSLWSIFFHHV